MKKVFIFFAIGIVVMATLLSCGNNNEEKEIETSTEIETTIETEVETVDLTKYELKSQPSFISIYDLADINGYTIRCFDKYDENTIILFYSSNTDQTFKIAKFDMLTAELDVISDFTITKYEDMYQDFVVKSISPYIVYDSYSYKAYVFDEDLKNYKTVEVPEYKVNELYYSSFNNCLYFQRLDDSSIQKYDLDNDSTSCAYQPDLLYTSVDFKGFSENGEDFVLYCMSQKDGKQYTLFVNKNTQKIDYKVLGYNKVFEDKDELVIVSGNDNYTNVIKRAPALKTEIIKYTLSDSLYLEINDFSAEDNLLISYCGSESDQAGFDFFAFNVDTGKKDHVSYFNMEAYTTGEIVEDFTYPDLSDTEGYFEEYDMYLFGIFNSEGVVDLLLWNVDEGKADADKVTVVTEYDYEEYQADPEIYYSGITEKAEELENKYGLHIYIGDNAVINFLDYSVEANTDVYVMEQALDIMTDTLSEYPEGFFADMCAGTSPIRGICVFLTGNMTSTSEGSIDDPAGFAVETDSIQIIALNVNCIDTMEQNLFHEISHAIDKKIDRESLWGENPLFDEELWNSYNPAGFDYVYSYFDAEGQPYNIYGDVSNTGSSESYYLNNDVESVYFVDAYSKTYPTEDRARLMEYLMEDSYDEDYFYSSHIQAKLTYYFEAIRKAFNNPKWPEKTFWEQKLQQFQN